MAIMALFLMQGGDTRFLHCWAKTTPLFWGTGLLFLLFSLTRKLGGGNETLPSDG